MTEDLVHPGTVARRFITPAGKLYLLYGDPLLFRAALAITSQVLLEGMPVVAIDGCNRFDVHAIARVARQQNLPPAVLLGRIYVSRGFTCYQMEAAITGKLLPMLRRCGARTALILGVLDTMYDEQARFREVRQMLLRIVGTLRAMRAGGISVLLACQEWKVQPAERNELLATLKESVDDIYRLERNEDDKPKLFLERSVSYGTHRTDLYRHP
jgi:hypothetical protein